MCCDNGAGLADAFLELAYFQEVEVTFRIVLSPIHDMADTLMTMRKLPTRVVLTLGSAHNPMLRQQRRRNWQWR